MYTVCVKTCESDMYEGTLKRPMLGLCTQTGTWHFQVAHSQAVVKYEQVTSDLNCSHKTILFLLVLGLLQIVYSRTYNLHIWVYKLLKNQHNCVVTEQYSLICTLYLLLFGSHISHFLKLMLIFFTLYLQYYLVTFHTFALPVFFFFFMVTYFILDFQC